MKLFRKRKALSGVDNALSIRIGAIIHQRQLQASTYLNRKTQYWNRASKLTALFLFCLLFGGGCLVLLLKAIIHF